MVEDRKNTSMKHSLDVVVNLSKSSKFLANVVVIISQLLSSVDLIVEAYDSVILRLSIRIFGKTSLITGR